MAAEVLSLEGRLTTLLNFSLIFAILSRFQSHKTLNIYKWSLLKKNCYIYNLELRKQNKKKSNRKNQKCQISSSPLESFCNCLEGIQRREDRRAPTSEAEREGREVAEGRHFLNDENPNACNYGSEQLFPAFEKIPR